MCVQPIGIQHSICPDPDTAVQSLIPRLLHPSLIHWRVHVIILLAVCIVFCLFFLCSRTLDPERQLVRCVSALDPGREYDVSYDVLVIGVGAVPNDFNIPGVKEYAFFLKVSGHVTSPLLFWTGFLMRTKGYSYCLYLKIAKL